MDIIRIIEILEGKKENDEFISIFFTQKSNRKKKYKTFKVDIKKKLQNEIIDFILPYLHAVKNNEQTAYNPRVIEMDKIVKLNVEGMQNVGKFLSSLNEDDLIRDNRNNIIKFVNISFYSIVIDYYDNGVEKKIYLISQFQKATRLRASKNLCAVDNELKRMESDFVSINSQTDLILLEDSILVLKNNTLNIVFDYIDELVAITKRAIKDISQYNIIENVADFENDCLNNKNVLKRFVSISEKNLLESVDINKIKSVIKERALDVNIEAEKIIYDDKSQLMSIVKILDDAFYTTDIGGRKSTT